MTAHLHSVRAMADDGGFTASTRVGWAHGRFELGGTARPGDLDGTGLWLIPGLVDTHVHAAWHAFDGTDRDRVAPRVAQQLTAAALARTLAAGVTSARDAGGLTAAMAAELPDDATPRLQLSVALIDRAAAEAAGGLAAAVEAVLERGARWVKLVATAGVAAPAGTDLAPVFSRAEIDGAVRRAAQSGAGVMVHAWGGPAIDDAIEAGAMSIEHGMYLTDVQAHRAAERGMTLVPTLRIYRLVQRMIADGSLPAAFRARVDEAVGVHPLAVRRARDAGLAIALGTDYGTTAQHGTNRLEVEALMAAGLSAPEALVAATRSGAALLARVAADPAAAPDGRIADGSVADAVLLRADPRIPGALSDPDAVVAVIRGGAVVHGEIPTPSAIPIPIPTPSPPTDLTHPTTSTTPSTTREEAP